MIRPNHYKTTAGFDLWTFFRKGLLTPVEFAGFLKGNIYKYIYRYNKKNGIEDLQKSQTYIDELIKFKSNAVNLDIDLNFLIDLKIKELDEFMDSNDSDGLSEEDQNSIISQFEALKKYKNAEL